MQTYFTIMGWNLVAVAAMMVTGWLISLAYRNVTVVDSLWGLGFVLIAWLTFFMSDGYGGRKMLIAILVTLWGLRLSLYLTWRNWGKGEGGSSPRSLSSITDHLAPNSTRRVSLAVSSPTLRRSA